MKIAVGCDGAGFGLKQVVLGYLDEHGYEYTDLGAFDDAPVDYPVFAEKVVRAVLAGEVTCGILVCGTGNGIAMAANRFKGIRAAVCYNAFTAKSARSHNDANIIALGERVIGTGTALECIAVFLATPFSGEERHKRRIGMM